MVRVHNIITMQFQLDTFHLKLTYTKASMSTAFNTSTIENSQSC